MIRPFAFLRRRRVRQAQKIHAAKRLKQDSRAYGEIDRSRMQSEARGGFDAGGGGSF